MFVLGTMAVVALRVLPAAGATGDAAPPNPAWVLPDGTLDPTQVPETQYMGADGNHLLPRTTSRSRRRWMPPEAQFPARIPRR